MVSKARCLDGDSISQISKPYPLPLKPSSLRLTVLICELKLKAKVTRSNLGTKREGLIISLSLFVSKDISQNLGLNFLF
jgi:hypothetical protein